MSTPKRYTVTAALPYANGPVHIGHLAGAYISADIYVRYLRLQGKDVVFVCGSDEHGAAITIKAKKEGITPREIIDKYHAVIRDGFKQFGISFDIYHRTSEPIHYQTSQDIFRTLYEKNAFEVIESEQYFDTEAGQFLADRYIMGTCPKCGNENAYGDQCEKCGSSLNPTDLIHPRSTISGSTPVLKSTKHWFLKLDEYQPEIEAWLKTKKDSWKAHVYGQCMSWMDAGLQPRAMTRDLDWGIPVPQEIEGAEGKVLYVWLDAPIGYISATRQLFKEIEEQNFTFATPQSRQLEGRNSDDWRAYWQSEDTQLVHFIGKDNIVFHCITFPAILKATGQYILPTQVPANEFMNLQGDKISTSRNWAVWLHEYLQEFPGKEDELRYTLIANMPEQKDSEFTWQDYQSRVNNELVANIGNFVNRVMVLLHKYYDGVLPIKEHFTEADQSVFEQIDASAEKIAGYIEQFRFRDALNALNELSSSGNKYLADHEPWKLIKTQPEEVERIMLVAAQVAGALGILSQPLLPFTATKICDMLCISRGEWLKKGTLPLQGGEKVNASALLFTKVEDSVISAQVEKLAASKQTSQNAAPSFVPVKESISYDDFAKMDIRTGIITAAAKVPKADKLLQLSVDLGFEQRTIVSGIAEHFAPEAIIGQQVSVLVNLAPRKLRGIESNGMILMAEDAEGKLHFVGTPDIAAGQVIR